MIGYEHGLRHIEVRLDQYTLLMFKHTAAPEKGGRVGLGSEITKLEAPVRRQPSQSLTSSRTEAHFRRPGAKSATNL
jgi:hypothetical protein